jgi:AraC family transcriptional activator of mar-sox-rob regulon
MIWGSAGARTVKVRNRTHAHDMHEIVTCLSDTGLHWVNGRTYPFRRGRTILLPGDVPHHVVGTARESAVLAYVCFDSATLAGEGGHDLVRALDLTTVNRNYGSGVSPEHCRHTLALTDRLQAELAGTSPFAPSLVRGLLLELLVVHCRSLALGPETEPDPAATRIAAACARINQNPVAAVHLDVEAKTARLSRSLFTRTFRRQTGMSLMEFVLVARIRDAMRHLAETHEPVAAVAFECGFRNVGHFHRTFRRLVHMTPRQYRCEVARRGPFVTVLSESHPSDRTGPGAGRGRYADH